LSPIATAGIAFVLIVASTVAGALVRSRMPEHHLTGDSKEVIRLATALVATLTGLVLALMFASTRTSFEHTSAAVSRLAVSFAELDEVLEDYGPPALPIRRQLRADLQPLLDSIWQDDAVAAGRPRVSRRSHATSVTAMIRELQPANPGQAALQARALQITADISQTRLALLSQPPDSVSAPFIIVVVLWLMFIFTTFAMSSKPNATLIVVLCICILSASGALYLILELGLPFDGLMQVSNDNLRQVLTPI
jgi:Protein of unknown function (DUF4239)